MHYSINYLINHVMQKCHQATANYDVRTPYQNKHLSINIIFPQKIMIPNSVAQTGLELYVLVCK